MRLDSWQVLLAAVPALGLSSFVKEMNPAWLNLCSQVTVSCNQLQSQLLYLASVVRWTTN
jgi:hypothetical protein